MSNQSPELKSLKKILKFLKQSISTKYDENGNSVLHDAVKTNNESIVNYVIAAGCDVNKKNNSDELPLELAINNGNLNITKILLEAEAKFENTYFRHSRGPLHMAIQEGLIDIVKELIRIGADVNARDCWGDTPLHLANTILNSKQNTYWNNYGTISKEITKILVNAGADIYAKISNEETPIHYAIINDCDDSFSFLISINSEIHIDELLHYAGANLRIHAISELVKFGANVKATGVNGNTCLHMVARSPDYNMNEVVEYLLNNGAAINALNDDDLDPLCEGLRNWPDILDRGGIYGDTDSYSDTLGHHEDCLNLLIERGADINRINKNNLTSLYIVLSCNTIVKEFVHILLKNGAKFDFEHPLVLNVMNDDESLVISKLFVRHAALFESQNRSGGFVNFNVKKLNNDLRRYYAGCRDELELMKETMICNTNVTFFKIMANRDIGFYTQNDNVKGIFETDYVSKQFPIYCDLINERFSEKLENQTLVRRATASLSRVLNWNESSSKVILTTIIGYLNKKDLVNLADM